jgi:hypothetical protein
MKRTFLILGDLLVLAIVTVLGFASHGEAGAVSRMLTTFTPLLVSWFLIAPWLGLFDQQTTNKPGQLWRPILAMLLAAPLAGWLRAVVLNTVVIPIFVAVLGVVSALGMLIWRAIWLWLGKRIVK